RVGPVPPPPPQLARIPRVRTDHQRRMDVASPAGFGADLPAIVGPAARSGNRRIAAHHGLRSGPSGGRERRRNLDPPDAPSCFTRSVTMATSGLRAAVVINPISGAHGRPDAGRRRAELASAVLAAA